MANPGRETRVGQLIEETNYAAVHRGRGADGREVIVKIAREASPQANELIAREFQILAGFQHPGIVRVHDYDVGPDGRAFFTADLVPGKPLNACFRKLTTEFMRALVQVLNALGAFHERGFVHTDLKPEHILYDRATRRAVLIDFGYARISSTLTAAAGTLGYIAPEVIKGMGVDQRSDVYSLGVICYEILAGHLPREPLDPIPGVNDTTMALIERTLAAEPAIRPNIPELIAHFTPAGEPAMVASFRVSLPMTGYVRIPELAKFFEGPFQDRLIVQGGTGMGKTRFLQELRYHYLRHGWRVCAYSAGTEESLGSALARFLSVADCHYPGDDRYRAYEELLQGMREQTQLCAIIVDDLDLTSELDQGLVRYLGHDLPQRAAIIASTSRAELADTIGFAKTVLRDLDADEIATLLRQTFFALQPDPPTPFAEWLHRQTGGNPWFMVETFKLLNADGIVRFEDNCWHCDLARLESTRPPAHVDGFLQHAISGMDAGARAILNVLAVARCSLSTGLLERICGGPVNLHLESLKQRHLVREDTSDRGGRLWILSNQALARVLESATEELELRRLRTSVIEELLRDGSTRGSDATLGRLSAEIGEYRRAADYYTAASEVAERNSDLQSALEHLKNAQKLASRSGSRIPDEHILRAARLAMILGRVDEGQDLYRQVEKRSSGAAQATARIGIGKILSVQGRLDEAESLLRNAIAVLSRTEETRREHVKALHALAYCLVQRHDISGAAAALDRADELVRTLDDPELEAAGRYNRVVMQLSNAQHREGYQTARDMAVFCRAHDLHKDYGLAMNLAASALLEMADYGGAERILDEALPELKRRYQTDAVLYALHSKTLLAFYRGAHSDAERLCLEAIGRSRQMGLRNYTAHLLGTLGSVFLDAGRYADAVARITEAVELDRDPYYVLELVQAHALMGNIVEAEKVISDLIAPHDPRYGTLAKVYVAGLAGRLEDADREIEEVINALLEDPANRSRQAFLNVMAIETYYYGSRWEKVIEHCGEIARMTAPYVVDKYVKGLSELAGRRLGRPASLDVHAVARDLRDNGCLRRAAEMMLAALEYDAAAGSGTELPGWLDDLRACEQIVRATGAAVFNDRLARLKLGLFPVLARESSRRSLAVEYVEVLSSLATLIAERLGADDFVQELLDLVIRASRAERGALFVRTGDRIEFVAGRNMDRTTIQDASVLSRTVVLKVKADQPIYTSNAAADPEYSNRRSVQLNQIRSLVCLPLTVSGSVIGAIYLDSRVPDFDFGERDQGFLMTVSRMVASVIEKATAFRTLLNENMMLKSSVIEEIGRGYLVGVSRPMKHVYQLVERIASALTPVLITGETGTGKGMVARLIHRKSERQGKRFMTINCGTITDTLLESELFGHKKGSFTGAINDKRGLLEEAEGGTLFLDEITNTSASFQAKLLEAIEDKVIRRVGETETRSIDVRFLFATNRDLEIEVEEGRFRKDLYYRINVFTIEMPPLRERGHDVMRLAHYFLERYCAEIGKRLTGFTPEACSALESHVWPGNVRELQNMIERAVVLGTGPMISARDLGLEHRTVSPAPMQAVKEEAVRNALAATNGNVTRAAKLLGVNRRTLHRLIHKYHLR